MFAMCHPKIVINNQIVIGAMDLQKTCLNNSSSRDTIKKKINR